MKTDPFWRDLFARRRAKLQAKEETWQALLAALAGAPFFIFFDAQGDPGRGMVAAIVVMLFYLAIRFYWHLRYRPWFIITIVF